MTEPTFTDIRGKQYETVDSRVRRFRDDHPTGEIKTKVLVDDDTRVLMRAKIKIDGKRVASGLAEEIRGSSNINQTSAVENCETSAVGRALGFAGYDAAGSIASADEVSRAIDQQQSTSIPPTRSGASQAESGRKPGREVLPAGRMAITLAGEVEKKTIKKASGGTFDKFEFTSTLGHKFETTKKEAANEIEMARRNGNDVEFEHDAGAYGSHKIKPWTVRVVEPGAAEPIEQEEAPAEVPDHIPF